MQESGTALTRGERHRLILEEIAGGASVDVRDLAQRFNVAEMTVRRDLAALGEAGKVARVHGGAKPPSALDYEVRAHTQGREKRRIAALVAELIPPGSVVGLDMGSTCHAVAQEIAQRDDLIIATYSIRIALAFQGSPSQLVLLGGAMTDELTLVGLTEAQIPVNVDVLVLGCAGVDGESVSCFNLAEAAVRRSLIARSNRVILAADHTKFTRVGPFNYASTRRVDDIVTDAPPAPELRERLPESTTLHVAA